MVLNRREREKRERREMILGAAKVVFAEKGFDGAVLDEIAKLAEFSKGAIYGYFKNKDDLFISLVKGELDKLTEVTKSIVESSLSPIEKIKELVQGILSYFEENKEFFRIFMPEHGGFPKKKYHKAMKKTMSKYHGIIEMVAQVMEEGIKSGVLKKIEPVSLALALFGLVHSSIGRGWIIEKGKRSLKQDVEVITTIFLDGARR